MACRRNRLLTNGNLKRLRDRKYRSSSTSFLDSILQPWWNWLTSKLPLWIAPNVISLTGLLVNILTTLILVWYSPDARKEAPGWACFASALGLFVYQTLDALDGKQARRTGTSNPLGELFDHGCDSISTVFVVLSTCISVQLGFYPPLLFFQCFCALTVFYCAHWQTYVSGTMRFGKVDVTEAQFIIIFIHMISAIYGPSIWMTRIPYLNIELKYGLAVSTVFLCTVALYKYLFVIFTGGVGKNGSTVAGTSVLSPIIPLSFAVLPAYIIYRKSEEQVYENHPALYILSFGLVAAKATNRLIVAHMTRNEIEYFDSILIGPTMLCLNQYFDIFFREYMVLWACLIWVIVNLVRYSSRLCLEICDHLKIPLFRIPSKPFPFSSSEMYDQLTLKNVSSTELGHDDEAELLSESELNDSYDSTDSE